MLHSDLLFTPCKKCGRGEYVESTLRDHIERTLHCNLCNHRIDRWINADHIEPALEKRLTLAE